MAFESNAVTRLPATASERLEYCLGRQPVSARARAAVERIKNAYEEDSDPWVVGYSGGKDSSAVLKVLFHALRLAECHHKLVTVVYCDTGVEIPVAAELAAQVMAGFQKEAQSLGLPISTKILKPRLNDRFFVKVIGRGYPPPTDKFRWCTERLRINPVTDFLRSVDSREAVVVLGVRENESATRNLTLKENSGQGRYWKIQDGYSDRRLFMPILDFQTDDVWRLLLQLPTPISVRGRDVANLYSAASGECPTIRDPVAPPCGKARFGCWTCTVAKTSQTLANFASTGETNYAALQEYRVWLATSRNELQFRWKHRRNGAAGLGPMSMPWRRIALNRLLSIQSSTGLALIEDEEVALIKEYWENDRRGQKRSQKVAI